MSIIRLPHSYRGQHVILLNVISPAHRTSAPWQLSSTISLARTSTPWICPIDCVPGLLTIPKISSLWVNERQELVGWAVLQTPFWTLDLACHPEVEEDLLPQILSWGDARARPDRQHTPGASGMECKGHFDAIRSHPYPGIVWFCLTGRHRGGFVVGGLHAARGRDPGYTPA